MVSAFTSKPFSVDRIYDDCSFAASSFEEQEEIHELVPGPSESSTSSISSGAEKPSLYLFDFLSVFGEVYPGDLEQVLKECGVYDSFRKKMKVEILFYGEGEQYDLELENFQKQIINVGIKCFEKMDVGETIKSLDPKKSTYENLLILLDRFVNLQEASEEITLTELQSAVNEACEKGTYPRFFQKRGEDLISNLIIFFDENIPDEIGSKFSEQLDQELELDLDVVLLRQKEEHQLIDKKSYNQRFFSKVKLFVGNYFSQIFAQFEQKDLKKINGKLKGNSILPNAVGKVVFTSEFCEKTDWELLRKMILVLQKKKVANESTKGIKQNFA